VVLWELLTGHQYLQIAGLDPAAALAVVRHPKPAPPSSRAPWVTPALDAVVMRALALDRSKRFPNAEEFRLALSDAIAEAAPRTDAARVSELMHAIYHKAMAEEAAERERFVKDVLPSFRASTTPSPDEAAALAAVASKYARAAHGKNGKAANGGDSPRMAPAPSEAAEREARRKAKREAAMMVLAELAGENGATSSRK
jgi:serine/threonine-protein kinase